MNVHDADDDNAADDDIQEKANDPHDGDVYDVDDEDYDDDDAGGDDDDAGGGGGGGADGAVDDVVDADERDADVADANHDGSDNPNHVDDDDDDDDGNDDDDNDDDDDDNYEDDDEKEKYNATDNGFPILALSCTISESQAVLVLAAAAAGLGRAVLHLSFKHLHACSRALALSSRAGASCRPFRPVGREAGGTRAFWQRMRPLLRRPGTFMSSSGNIASAALPERIGCLTVPSSAERICLVLDLNTLQTCAQFWRTGSHRNRLFLRTQDPFTPAARVRLRGDKIGTKVRAEKGRTCGVWLSRC